MMVSKILIPIIRLEGGQNHMLDILRPAKNAVKLFKMIIINEVKATYLINIDLNNYMHLWLLINK